MFSIKEKIVPINCSAVKGYFNISCKRIVGPITVKPLQLISLKPQNVLQKFYQRESFLDTVDKLASENLSQMESKRREDCLRTLEAQRHPLEHQEVVCLVNL